MLSRVCVCVCIYVIRMSSFVLVAFCIVAGGVIFELEKKSKKEKNHLLHMKILTKLWMSQRSKMKKEPNKKASDRDRSNEWIRENECFVTGLWKWIRQGILERCIFIRLCINYWTDLEWFRDMLLLYAHANAFSIVYFDRCSLVALFYFPSHSRAPQFLLPTTFFSRIFLYEYSLKASCLHHILGALRMGNNIRRTTEQRYQKLQIQPNIYINT